MKKFAIFAIAFMSLTASRAQDVMNISETSATTPVAEEAKPTFGFLSYADAMKSMPEYEAAMQAMAQLKASYDAELERAEKDFSKKFSEYVDGQQSFPENIMLKRQKELQQLMQQSIDFKNEAKRLLAEKEAELMAPLKERLKTVITLLGKERNYSYILNTDNNSYLFINDSAGQGEDVSEVVRLRLQ